MTDKIICKLCSGKSEDGCFQCGGYGYVAQRCVCHCGREYWTKPGAYTSYEGKRWKSIDGLVLIDHQSGTRCIHCDPVKTII